MATERLLMRHIREILRLKWTLRRSHRETARSLEISAGAVASVVTRAKAICAHLGHGERTQRRRLSHTAHRHHRRVREREEPRRTKTQTVHWRRTPVNLFRSSASLRSDHDAVVPVITIALTG